MTAGEISNFFLFEVQDWFLHLCVEAKVCATNKPHQQVKLVKDLFYEN